MLFCSFILSHPLFFSDFIFLSPYFFKIFSFLSPLFMTTTLVLLAFLTPRFVNHGGHNFPEPEVSFLLTTYQTLDHHESYGDFGCLEDIEAFKIVLETRDNPDEILDMESKGDCFQAVEEAPILLDGVENLWSKKRDKQVKSLSVEPNKVDEQKGYEILTRGSKAVGNIVSEHAAKAMGSEVWNFGSMRKQKDWKRTLACKLFEERHSHDVDGGGERMDLLWETYETDSNITAQLKSSWKKGGGGGGKNNGSRCDNDNYDQEETNGHLCCLHALKLSSGKMNFGMISPSLVKISKAIKGIGWLHHVSSSRHGNH